MFNVYGKLLFYAACCILWKCKLPPPPNKQQNIFDKNQLLYRWLFYWATQLYYEFPRIQWTFISAILYIFITTIYLLRNSFQEDAHNTRNFSFNICFTFVVQRYGQTDSTSVHWDFLTVRNLLRTKLLYSSLNCT